MPSNFNSFDQSALGAFIQSALGARGPSSDPFSVAVTPRIFASSGGSDYIYSDGSSPTDWVALTSLMTFYDWTVEFNLIRWNNASGRLYSPTGNYSGVLPAGSPIDLLEDLFDPGLITMANSNVAFVDDNGDIYFVFGDVSGTDNYAAKWTASTQTWSRLGCTASEGISNTGNSLVPIDLIKFNNQLYLIINANSSIVDRVWRYTIATDTWSPYSVGAGAFGKAAGVTVYNNELYFDNNVGVYKLIDEVDLDPDVSWSLVFDKSSLSIPDSGYGRHDIVIIAGDYYHYDGSLFYKNLTVIEDEGTGDDINCMIAAGADVIYATNTAIKIYQDGSPEGSPTRLGDIGADNLYYNTQGFYQGIIINSAEMSMTADQVDIVSEGSPIGPPPPPP